MPENHEKPKQCHHRHEDAVPGRWNWYEGNDPENDRENEYSDENGDHMTESDTTDQTQAEACNHLTGVQSPYSLKFVYFRFCPMCGKRFSPTTPENPSVEPKKVPLGDDECQDTGTGSGGLEK